MITIRRNSDLVTLINALAASQNSRISEAATGDEIRRKTFSDLCAEHGR